MIRRAPFDLHGVDGVGVRRRIKAGDVIPPGLTPEVRLPDAEHRLHAGSALEGRAAAPIGPVGDPAESSSGGAPAALPDDLSALRVHELRALAARLGVPIPTGTRKDAMIEILESSTRPC